MNNSTSTEACEALAPEPFLAALVQIIKLCEDYQNADIEGCDPERVQADADRLINLICI